MAFSANWNSEKKRDGQFELLVDHDELAREAPQPPSNTYSDSGSHRNSIVKSQNKGWLSLEVKAVLLIIGVLICGVGGLTLKILRRQHRHELNVQNQVEQVKFNQDFQNAIQQRNEQADRDLQQMEEMQNEVAAGQKQLEDTHKMIQNLPDVPDFLKQTW